MKVKEWTEARKMQIIFVAVILVIQFLPLLTFDRPMTLEEWQGHTVSVLIAAAILAVIMAWIWKRTK